MPNYVKSVKANGIYGRFDLAMEFQPGVNILHGKNGTGKTTLLHILANVLSGKYERFVFFAFDSIQVLLDDDILISLNQFQEKDDLWISIDINGSTLGRFPVKEIRRLLLESSRHRGRSAVQLRLFEDVVEHYKEFDELGINFFQEDEDRDNEIVRLHAAYFPAFRTMIDAWASVRGDKEHLSSRRSDWTPRATHFARQWFGRFIPPINYPSLLEIEERLTDEIHQARLTIGRADRELFSQAFLQIFESLSESADQEKKQAEFILQDIRSLFDRLEESPLQEESTLVTSVYTRLRKSIHDLEFAEESERTAVRVLDVYRKVLEKVVEVQEQSFIEIQQYLESVNEFMEGKKLIVDPSIPRYRRGAVGIGFSDGTKTRGLQVLSSGERQIVTLIYAATHMSEQKVVLIDEPEISLHVDWQRQLIRKMSEQIGERQIIACTHSPVIGADYEERQIEIELKPAGRPFQVQESLIDEDEEIPF